MRLLTEQEKKATPAVIECGIHASPQEALQAAIGAIESILGIDSPGSRRLVEDLQGLELIETYTRTVGRPATLPFIVGWRLTKTGYEHVRSEANAWVESQFKSECEALGVDRNSVSWIEPGRDVLPLTGLELARIAAGDPGYRDDPDFRNQIAIQIRQVMKKARRRSR
ncbi:MAG: hypothetical protein ACR2IV_02500 [Bryobacteraceae bacterium]